MHTDVSEAYKSIINDDIRPVSQFQAELDAYDSDAETGVSFSYTGMTSGSSTYQWPREIQPFYPKATFEPGRMIVGSNQKPSTAASSEWFLISNNLSRADGTFSTAPTVTITLAAMSEIPGMVLSFSEDYASEIRVTLYANNTQVAQFTEYPDGITYSSYGSKYVSCNKIKIEFLQMSAPYRRLRLLMIRLGLILLLNNDNVSSATYTAEVDPISSTMSRYSLTINVIDEEGLFNPDNPQGIWDAFHEKQALYAKMGTTVGDSIETVSMVPLYLTSAPISTNRQAVFEAVDSIQTFLNVPYDPISNDPEARLSIVIYRALAFDASLGIQTVVDADLYNETCLAPLEYSVTSREALQMAANAGRAVVWIDSDGTVNVAKQDSSATMTGYSLTYDQLFAKPSLDFSAKIKDINVSWYVYTASDTASTLFEGDVILERGISRNIAIPCSTNITVTITGVTGGSSTVYYNHVWVRATSSGTAHVTITGKKYTQDIFSVVVPVSTEGETINIDNKCVTSPEAATALGKWVADHYSYRQAYTGSMRQDFLLEANDAIELETDYGNVPIRLYYLEYSIPGQQGRYEGRRVNAVG